MSELSQLSPQPLWDIFAKICSIPHPSYHEEQLAEHIMGWAKEKGLHAERDQVGNILIRKGATAGMENRKPVALQAHLDMVPQKNNDTVHDFVKDPIQPYIDGEWVKARGTTLGADNGIGMASALAVLADDSVAHGPLEVLLTMTEEAGMDGAFGLQANWLQADILINTDSEEEGEIYMGCAGGIDFTSNLALTREAVPAGFQSFKLTLKGLKGGHSGGEIHVGLGNANKLLARFLAGHAQELDLRLVDFNGGTLRNAIPREAFATVAVAAGEGLVVGCARVLHHRGEEAAAGLALGSGAVRPVAGTRTTRGRVHARHRDVAAERQRLEAVLGLADPARPQRRAEADHVLPDPHAEALGGEEVTELVQRDRDREPDDEQRDPDDEGDDGHSRREYRAPL